MFCRKKGFQATPTCSKTGTISKDNVSKTFVSGEPALVDRVLALHAGSRGFDSHQGHMSE